MKIGIGLAAALAVALLSPGFAFAQDAATIAKQRPAGMADAPAVVQQYGLACTVKDAFFMGESTVKGTDGKSAKSKVYEVACNEGSGYILGNPSPLPLDCLKLQTVADRDVAEKKKSSVPTCKLPANADAKMGLAPSIQQAGLSCSLAKARWVGESPTAKIDQYEIGCTDGSAYLLNIPQPGSTLKLSADSCMKMAGREGSQCQYFTKESAVASIKAMAAKTGRACDVSDGRYVATKTAGGEFYEVGCTDGKSGYMLETDAKGAFTRAIACAQADAIAGGCTLTKIETAGSTADAAIYTKATKAIGYNCNVSKYRSLGVDSGGREMVEVACSDRPDGAFVLLPVKDGQKGENYNCVRSEARNQQCKLSEKSAVFEKIKNQLENKGKAGCTVSGTRGVGQTANGEDVVEVGCTGGVGVLATFFKDSDSIGLVTPCTEASKLGTSCSLK